MNKSIEQMVEELMRHTGVWDETKATLKELLADHAAGKLDPDDAKYIEGLYRKVTGRGAPSSSAGGAMRSQAAARAGVPANDTTAKPASTTPMTSPAALVAALRSDIASLVLPGDIAARSEDEQALRREIHDAIDAAIDDIAARTTDNGEPR